MSTVEQLVDWLLEQIAADEAEVHRFKESKPENHTGLGVEYSGEYITVNFLANHILAECAAKRAIIRFAAARDEEAFDSEPWIAERVLLLLASPYAGRPGFLDEWKA